MADSKKGGGSAAKTMGQAAKTKMGGLPVWAWGLILGGLAGVVFLLFGGPGGSAGSGSSTAGTSYVPVYAGAGLTGTQSAAQAVAARRRTARTVIMKFFNTGSGTGTATGTGTGTGNGNGNGTGDGAGNGTGSKPPTGPECNMVAVNLATGQRIGCGGTGGRTYQVTSAHPQATTVYSLPATSTVNLTNAASTAYNAIGTSYTQGPTDTGAAVSYQETSTGTNTMTVRKVTPSGVTVYTQPTNTVWNLLHNPKGAPVAAPAGTNRATIIADQNLALSALHGNKAALATLHSRGFAGAA